MRKQYRIDDDQQIYFVKERFEDFLEQTLETDFGPFYVEFADALDIKTETVLPTDKAYTRGTHDHAREKSAA